MLTLISAGQESPLVIGTHDSVRGGSTWAERERERGRERGEERERDLDSSDHASINSQIEI